MTKIKDLKEWCNTKDDDDIVFACEYSYNSESYTKPTSVQLWVRPSQKKKILNMRNVLILKLLMLKEENMNTAIKNKDF